MVAIKFATYILASPKSSPNLASMAVSFSSPSLILGISTLCLLISPALSQTCKSQKLTNNNVYSHCLDLPTLTSYLHFSYDSSNRSLSVAFVATPSNSNGWVAWAINPTGTGMAGAQSLVAYKDSTGAVTVKTFNISGYSSVVPENLSFEVWETGADESGGFIRIYGKLKMPEELAKAGKVNQIWQVGPGVGADGMLEKHAFESQNVNAKGTLDLSGAQSTVVSTGTDSRTKKKNVSISVCFNCF